MKKWNTQNSSVEINQNPKYYTADRLKIDKTELLPQQCQIQFKMYKKSRAKYPISQTRLMDVL